MNKSHTHLSDFFVGRPDGLLCCYHLGNFSDGCWSFVDLRQEQRSNQTHRLMPEFVVGLQCGHFFRNFSRGCWSYCGG